MHKDVLFTSCAQGIGLLGYAIASVNWSFQSVNWSFFLFYFFIFSVSQGLLKITEKAMFQFCIQAMIFL